MLAAVMLPLVPLPWGGGTVGIGPAWVHSWLPRDIAVAWLAVVAAGLLWAPARVLCAGRPARGRRSGRGRPVGYGCLPDRHRPPTWRSE